MSRKYKSAAVTRYWMDFYSGSLGTCTLCGNSGVVDTRRTAIPTCGGLSVGRRNYCICPNGQALRKSAADGNVSRDRRSRI